MQVGISESTISNEKKQNKKSNDLYDYQYIYTNKKNGSKLYENLRQKRKYRKKRLLKKEKRGVIPNKVMIADRPPEVETRERYGDWEGDTIIDGVPTRANHQGAIATANRENTNGLIRQYIPRKSDGAATSFSNYSVKNISEIQQKLNNRPRKTLEFDSPIQNLTKNKIAFQS